MLPSSPGQAARELAKNGETACSRLTASFSFKLPKSPRLGTQLGARAVQHMGSKLSAAWTAPQAASKRLGQCGRNSYERLHSRATQAHKCTILRRPESVENRSCTWLPRLFSRAAPHGSMVALQHPNPARFGKQSICLYSLEIPLPQLPSQHCRKEAVHSHQVGCNVCTTVKSCSCHWAFGCRNAFWKFWRSSSLRCIAHVCQFRLANKRHLAAVNTA